MKTNSSMFNLFSWVTGVIFSTIGILNIILVHPVPGIFYLVLSVIYLTPLYESISEKTGLSINGILKIGLAILIIWGSLGVGDLTELFEARMLRS